MEMSPTPQAYKRMIRLTFFSGFSLGSLVVLCVIGMNDLEFKHLGRFILDDPLVTNSLLPALSFAGVGIFWILEWRRDVLRVQFPALRSEKRASAQENSYWGYWGLAYGVMYLGLAGVQLLGIPFAWDTYHWNWPLITLCCMVGAFVLAWYLHRRSRHRSVTP